MCLWFVSLSTSDFSLCTSYYILDNSIIKAFQVFTGVSRQAKSMMANPQKRKHENMNVSEMPASSAATVHGVFVSLCRRGTVALL